MFERQCVISVLFPRQNEAKACNCPLPCTRVEYVTHLTSAQFSSQQVSRQVAKIRVIFEIDSTNQCVCSLYI